MKTEWYKGCVYQPVNEDILCVVESVSTNGEYIKGKNGSVYYTHINNKIKPASEHLVRKELTQINDKLCELNTLKHIYEEWLMYNEDSK